MNCQTCKDFAELQKVTARMERQVPWLATAVNVGLVWHLSVAHGLSYQDLGVYTSPDAPGADIADSLTDD